MSPRNGGMWDPTYGVPPAPVVHEQGPSDKPVLYDHRGNPLTYAKRQVGFEKPKERKP